MKFLRNLSSVETFDGDPWDFKDIPPEEVRADKAARDRWVNDPNTDWNCWTAYEGTIGNLRLRGGADGEDNPPLLMHGLVTDHDTKTTLEDVHAAMRIMGEIKPNWVEFTLSGNARLFFQFEEPVRFPSRKFAISFLKKIDTLIGFDRLPGLDKPALLTPEKVWTNSGNWVPLSRVLVPSAQLRGYTLRIAEKFDWRDKELGKSVVSWERLADELRKRYPRFVEWPGEFVEGSQGPTFFVDGSISPKSAIARATGLHTFSQHASKPFYGWAELAGAEFVQKSEDEFLGAATKDIWYDGKSYFRPGPDGIIHVDDATALRRHLVAMRGVSDRRPKDGGVAAVEKAIAFVDEHQRIAGAASACFYPTGVFTFNGQRILNLHKVEALRPAPGSATWGPAGQFPFLSAFYDGFFEPKFPQLDRFLAWAQLFYRSCLDRAPQSGHCVVLAGPVNVGKTFSSRGVLAGLVGGSAEAHAYLSGADSFNSDIFSFGLWTIDDGSLSTTGSGHRLFSEAIKRVVANRAFRVNEKFRRAALCPWQGRLILTLNDDPVSISGIPNLDGSILEKLMILRVGQRSIKFLSQPAMEKMLKTELPYFARWLLDWTPPAHCFEGADPRFGVTAYCEPTLHRTSNLSSAVSSFAEILTRWLTEYFNEAGNGQTFWTGSAIDLRLSMSASLAFAEVLRGYKPDAIPRMLLQLNDKKMFKMTVAETEGERRFTIHCEDRFRKPSKPPAPVPQAENSIFQK